MHVCKSRFHGLAKTVCRRPKMILKSAWMIWNFLILKPCMIKETPLYKNNLISSLLSISWNKSSSLEMISDKKTPPSAYSLPPLYLKAILSFSRIRSKSLKNRSLKSRKSMCRCWAATVRTRAINIRLCKEQHYQCRQLTQAMTSTIARNLNFYNRDHNTEIDTLKLMKTSTYPPR